MNVFTYIVGLVATGSVFTILIFAAAFATILTIIAASVFATLAFVVTPTVTYTTRACHWLKTVTAMSLWRIKRWWWFKKQEFK